MKLSDVSSKIQKNFYNELVSMDITDEYTGQVKQLVQEPENLSLEEIKLAGGYFGLDGNHRILVEFVFKSNYEKIIGQVLYHVESDKDSNVIGFGPFGNLKIISNEYVLE